MFLLYGCCHPFFYYTTINWLMLLYIFFFVEMIYSSEEGYDYMCVKIHLMSKVVIYVFK